MNKRRISRVLAALACAVPMLLQACPASAESYTGTLGALKSAIADTQLTSEFIQVGAITLDGALGAIGVSGTGSPTLTINGANYDLNGNGNSGITVSSTQTLNINNVGYLNSDSSVKTSWHGFCSTDGGAVSNAGVLKVADSVFFKNSASSTGGAIYNEAGGTLNVIRSTFNSNGVDATDTVITPFGGAIFNDGNSFNVSSSEFKGNSATSAGGAIYNNTSSVVESKISNSTFTNNTATNYAGAIYNASAVLTISNSDFTGNYAYSSSGAIYNSGTLNLVGSSFTGNGINGLGAVSTGGGGAIYNNSYYTTQSTISGSDFTGNAASSYGGAIYNDKGILNISFSDFVDNYTSTGGGAIFNNYNGSTTYGTLNVNNASFIGNGVDGADAVLTRFGGAIYNKSTATIKDSIFTGNKSLNAGGAIYNEVGTLNIKASAAGYTKFSGNIDGTGSNAIHMVAGALNLNAGAGGVIKFDDKITSADAANAITINSTSVDSSLTEGTVIFNNTVSDSTINLLSGKLFLGEFGNTLATNYLSNVALTQSGGVLSMANGNATDILSLSSFAANGGTLDFDVDLNSGDSDKISATTASGTLNLSNINVLHEGATANFKLFDTASPTLASDTMTTFTNNNKYEFNQDGAGGYNVTPTTLTTVGSGLNEAVLSSLTNRTFSATDNLTLTSALGAMVTDGSRLTIFGNQHNIIGTGLTTPAITTSATQKLNIIGVGSLNGDGSVATSWNGFSGANGGAISNVGTLSIFNSVFSGNTATSTGGFLYNNTADTVISTIYGSTFASNSATSHGGVIYNNSGILEIVNTTFKDNYTVNTNVYGGAIYNNTAGTLKIGKGTVFSHNGFNASNQVVSDWAGAIFNKTSKTSTIEGATFIGNAAKSYAGAIDSNQGVLIISDTDFIGNYTTGPSSCAGAIYNYTSPLTINNGSTFTGNGIDGNNAVKTINGGAIYDSTASNVLLTIDDVTFSGNAATTNGGAINNNSGKLAITGAKFTGNYTTTSSSFGGAIYSNSNTGQISYSEFIGNGIKSSNTPTTSQGGAIYINSSTYSPLISYSVFENNAATFAGGAIMSRDNLTISSCDFIGNYVNGSPSYGGAIDNMGTITITGESNFVGNGIRTVDSVPGVVTNKGGAIFNESPTTATIATISDTKFEKNAAITLGGAIYNYKGTLSTTNTSFISNFTSGASSSGGAIHNETTGLLSIDDGTTFIGNGLDSSGAVKTNHGGAIYSSGTGISTIDNALFTKNAVLSYGGAIYNAAGTLQISNSDFIGNYNYNSGNFGGAIYNSGVLSVSDSSFVGNGFDSAKALMTGRGAAIFNTTASAVESTITGSTFTGNAAAYRGGAICNPMGIMTITDSDFSGNYTTSASSDVSFGGGAIHNYYSSATDYGTLHISSGSTFTGNGINGSGNVATYFGGAINSNTLVTAISTIDNTTFTGNAANGRGGAIFNVGGILTITDTDFLGNYIFLSGFTTYGGGAIYNGQTSGTQYGTLNISNGSRFIGNGIDGLGAVKTGRGGAIFNSGGIINITDTEFTGNKATVAGGAIYNESGTLNIKASAGNTTQAKFTGNLANNVSNAIHLVAGTLNLNAGEGGKITFNDRITSDNRNNPININLDTVDAGLTTGMVVFNDLVSTSSINLYGGSLALGADKAVAGTYMSDVNITISGGVLDMENNVAGDTIALNNLTVTGGGLTIDANLATGVNDNITIAGTATGTLTINNINILSDAATASSTMTLVTGGTLTDLSLANYSVANSIYAYIFSQSATKGVYNVSRLAVNGLNYSVARSDLASRTFTATADADAEMALGAMGGAGSTLVIDGANNNINGKGYAGVSVASGQTLEIKNVGSLNPDGSVKTSWNGSIATTNGAVINNAGNLSITDSVFYNNSTNKDGGVLYNNTAIDVISTINGSTFSGNHTSSAGGAIYNNRGILIISDTDFSGNYASFVVGGAICNHYDGRFNINSGSIFIGNGRDGIGAVKTINGGAIINRVLSSSIESIINNARFESNAATTNGGAIYNNIGTLTIADTDFIGNYTDNSYGSACGGAIVNFNGKLNISLGSTFIGNGIDGTNATKTGYGGAIYNTLGTITVKDTTFTGNKALIAGGAIYNTSGTLNIQASAGNTTDMKFSGNFANSISNAIHLVAGTINLNAGEEGVITFDDKITSENIDNSININDSAVDSGLTTGTVIFNNTVSDSSINLKSGKLTLGQDNNSITSTYMNSVNLTMSGGVLDMENKVAGDTIALNNLTITGGTMTMDADLANGINDNITIAGLATGTLNISHMFVTADSVGNNLTMVLVSATGGGNISGLDLASFAAYTSNYMYSFTQSDTDGVYDVVKAGYGGLNAAVADTSAIRTFTALLDENVNGSLGAMGGTDSTLVIEGQQHNINGLGKVGISVASGQTLEIKNVGSLNPDGSVKTSWNGFISTTNGAAISNSGNLTITNSVLSNSSSTANGGALYNAYSGVLNVSDSDFVNNNSTSYSYGGGALFNDHGQFNINNGTTFVGNGDSASLYSGGAIYTSSQSNVESFIDNTIFTSNKSSNDGGAITLTSGILTITNSEFSENSSGWGGAIYNNTGSVLNISNTDFIDNSGALGGAIRTTGSGALHISNGSTFSGNSVGWYNRGGAICFDSSSTISTIDNAIFDRNIAGFGGGAIYIANGVLSISDADFNGNYTTYDTDYRGGGAIYVYKESDSLYGTLNVSSGSTFVGNGIDANGNVKSTYGGAIYNQGITTIKDTTFTGNKAITYGGAIYNAGTLNIQASAGNTTNMKFSGNIANGVSNAIYLAGGTLNLNAGEGGVITFDDKITSASRDNLININYSGAESNLTTGTVIFNNTVSDATIKLYDGTLTLGADNNTKTNTYLSNVNLTLLGGVLDIRNQNAQDLIELNNLEITDGSLATVSIDTDFANNEYDKISVSGTATGNLQLENVSLTSDSDLENFLMQFIVLGTGASVSGLNLEDYIAFTDDYEYDFTQSSTTLGAYNVDKIERYPSSGLNGAIESGARNRSYNALSDENALYALGNMGGTDSTLNINANSHKIGGAGFGGVNVLAGQTLNINTAASWNGFVSANGGAINNSGTVTITDSVIENNRAIGLGGAIYNAGTLNIFATAGNSTKFNGNRDSTGANAIYFKSGALNINAGSGGTVTFNDSITSESADNQININDSAINPTNTIGTVNFNNKINNAKVSVKAGNVNISNTSVNNAKFTMTGGTTTFSNATFGSNSNIFVNNADAHTILSGITQSGLNYSATDSFATVSAGTLNVANSTISGYSTAAQGGVINNAGTTTIVNSSFSNNSATSQGGAIYNSGTLNVVANGANTTFSNNKAAGALNDIYLASGSTLNINSGNGGAVYINSGITSADTTAQININNTNSSYPTSGAVVLNSAVTGSSVNMYNGTLHLSSDSYLDNNTLTMAGGTLSLANGSLGVSQLNTLNLTGNSYLTMDADLARGLSDKITAKTANSTNGAMLTLNGLNILSDTQSQANLAIADTNLSNYITLGASTVSSAIANYNLSYNSSSGSLSVTNVGFKPSVLATGSSALVGNYLTQTNTYHEAFANIDAIMAMPRYDRLLMDYGTKTADADGNFVFSPTMLPEDQRGYWVKEFTTFENVPLNNGPNVSNVAYGMLIGRDSELRSIGKGFRGYTSAYFGYMGSRQNFDNISSVQNGGLLGLTETVYKGDFFAALTANIGSSNGNNYTPSGTDNYTSIMAGIAAKTGYNFNVIGDKLIIQPSLTMSYTFANTFDYTTASGVDISSDPLNAIQLIPGLKFIANLKNGWQPYIGVNMVWSFMDKARFYANNIELPQASVDPYIEYGFGLQRKWGRFTGFGQAMARGGGRNGVALQFGFRWAIGK